MKVLYLDIPKFFANRDMLDALQEYVDEDGEHLQILRYMFNYTEESARHNPEFEEEFPGILKEHAPDFVFSFNFLPVVSKVCSEEGIKYVSWIYGNPEILLYSYHVINKCNIVLMFDSKQFETFWKGGIRTVEYMPLAASARRLDAMIPDQETIARFSSDISFVGSLYTERIRYYDEIAKKISPYALGYIDGMIRGQLQVDGVNIIEEALRPEIVDEIQRASNIYPHKDSAETREYLYANYIINRQATIIERREILTMIGEKYSLDLYTYAENNEFSPPGITNKGAAEYFVEMPYVFKLSKINLNITLRSIQNAIPLRCYDILGAGGFLLSNYQVDLARHFIPGEDYVFYENRKDILDKIEYYLSHEDERKAIAKNGHDKVKKEHTFDVRVKQIIELVKAKDI